MGGGSGGVEMLREVGGRRGCVEVLLLGRRLGDWGIASLTIWRCSDSMLRTVVQCGIRRLNIG